MGAAAFIGALFASAWWEADIRWLHFFQAWMYVATIVLSWSRNRWGYFIGIGAAAFWNYTNLFVTSFLRAGLNQAAILLHTGRLARPDLFISVPAWIGNLILILGCVLAYIQLSVKSRTDAWKLATACVGTTAYFGLIMALFQPRYLRLFPALLHPHLHL